MVRAHLLDLSAPGTVSCALTWSFPRISKGWLTIWLMTEYTRKILDNITPLPSRSLSWCVCAFSGKGVFVPRGTVGSRREASSLQRWQQISWRSQPPRSQAVRSKSLGLHSLGSWWRQNWWRVLLLCTLIIKSGRSWWKSLCCFLFPSGRTMLEGAQRHGWGAWHSSPTGPLALYVTLGKPWGTRPLGSSEA